jgi:hypothetical protein
LSGLQRIVENDAALDESSPPSESPTENPESNE